MLCAHGGNGMGRRVAVSRVFFEKNNVYNPVIGISNNAVLVAVSVAMLLLMLIVIQYSHMLTHERQFSAAQQSKIFVYSALHFVLYILSQTVLPMGAASQPADHGHGLSSAAMAPVWTISERNVMVEILIACASTRCRCCSGLLNGWGTG